ncbi:MAG: PKD domain-containing protein [Bacteroidetes bacterium]|nr:PKD domain-containing protein [Bacteroidota bacterium]
MKHFCKVILLLFIGSLPKLSAGQKCSITASTDKGCIPQPILLTSTITGAPTGATFTYAWNFGDGLTGSQQDSVTHIYSKRGFFSPSVVISWAGGKCTATVKKQIHIYDNPKAGFVTNAQSNIFLCDIKAKHCFPDSSKKGADSAKLLTWFWNFGDGEYDSTKNPCHHYFSEGSYLVSLEVKDSNGCKNFFQKKVNVKYLKKGGLPFIDVIVTPSPDCSKPYLDVLFLNKTDTSSVKITRFVWKFGDGQEESCNLTYASCLSRWSGIMHRYLKVGKYTPMLVIENIYGCKDSMQLSPVEVFPFVFKVFVPVKKFCNVFNTQVDFYSDEDPHPNSSAYWDFGDPYARPNERTSRRWITSHSYSMPGIYTVYYRRLVDTCYRDTIMCKLIKIYGPKARILFDKDLDVVPDTPLIRRIATADLKTYFSCKDSVAYWVKQKAIITNGDTTFDDPCKGNPIKTTIGTKLNCTGQYIPIVRITYPKKILSLKDKTVYLYIKKYWYKGDAIPYKDTPVYYVNNFTPRKFHAKDTDFYSPRCNPPKLIDFTNFSLKSREYRASDDFPPGTPNKCETDYNPNYPYASDSLVYFWDFGEGNGNVSTKASPDKRASYSTEKLPQHLFLDTGCFKVNLTVKDTLTGCESKDFLYVVVQNPDAGWDRKFFDTIKNMTAALQNKFAKYGKRRGFIVHGKPCVGETQNMDLRENLPKCYVVDAHGIFDYAASVKYRLCNGVPDKSKKYHEWDTAYTGYAGGYDKTGWKTVGLTISNNFWCKDTVWYHNYKYIHDVFSDFNKNGDNFCAGDTLKAKLDRTYQEGVKFVIFNYYYVPKPRQYSLIKRDTIPFIIHKNPLGGFDTITSSITSAGMEVPPDDTVFNNLNATSNVVLTKPGKYEITTLVIDRFGCTSTVMDTVFVGHYSDFDINNRNVCVGEKITLNPYISYMKDYFQDSIIGKYWYNPVGVRGGRKPQYPEKIMWDMDGDSIPDDSTFNPKWSYKKPGLYTIHLFTKDSLDCKWQVVKKKDYIRVIGVKANFDIDSPGFQRFCNPQFFKVTDNSSVMDTTTPYFKKVNILTWRWNTGDGYAYTKDSTHKNISFVQTHNGEYIITLVVRTETKYGFNGKGCADSTAKLIKIVGPQPRFKPIGDSVGCVPFLYKVLDYSRKSRFKNWRLGDSSTVATSAKDTALVADTVYLLYKKPGIFCPQLIGADSIRDFRGNINYCYDTFPFRKCQFRVFVYPHYKAKLINDSIVCVDKPANFGDASDSVFTKWDIDFTKPRVGCVMTPSPNA